MLEVLPVGLIYENGMLDKFKGRLLCVQLFGVHLLGYQLLCNYCFFGMVGVSHLHLQLLFFDGEEFSFSLKEPGIPPPV